MDSVRSAKIARHGARDEGARAVDVRSSCCSEVSISCALSRHGLGRARAHWKVETRLHGVSWTHQRLGVVCEPSARSLRTNLYWRKESRVFDIENGPSSGPATELTALGMNGGAIARCRGATFNAAHGTAYNPSPYSFQTDKLTQHR